MSRSEVKSAVYDTRVDVRTVATLCRYYIDQHDPPASLSGLISDSLEDFVDVLESNKLVKRVEDTLEAKQMLEATLGRATHKRGDRALIRQIQVETVTHETSQITADVEDIKFGERPTPEKKEEQ